MGKPERVKVILEKIDTGIASHSGEFLIGLIEVEEDSYCELLDFAGSLINNEAFVLRDEKSAIISASLVHFAIREFQNGQFWSEFATRLDIDEADAKKIGKKSFETASTLGTDGSGTTHPKLVPSPAKPVWMTRCWIPSAWWMRAC